MAERCGHETEKTAARGANLQGEAVDITAASIKHIQRAGPCAKGSEHRYLIGTSSKQRSDASLFGFDNECNVDGENEVCICIFLYGLI